MSGIAKPMAHSTTSTNPYAEVPVDMVVSVNDLSVPAIANYPAQYKLAFTLIDKTIITISYTTAALLATAKAAYRTNNSAAFA